MKLFLLTLLVAVAAVEWHSLTLETSGEWRVSEGKQPTAVAWGKYDRSSNQTGWNDLTIETNERFTDVEQATAAGYLEGWLCQEDIFFSHTNFVAGQMKGQNLTKNPADFTKRNLRWLKETVKDPHTVSLNRRYWHHVNLVLQQFDGIVKGYNDRAGVDYGISESQFLEFQLNCELGDINSSFTKMPLPNSDLHCSSLVKLTEGNKALYVGHNTWTSFWWMLRVWKNFKFNFATPSRSSFSSFPGVIPSNDDFFITSNNLVVTETTNDVYNTSLYRAVATNTVPYFIRVMVANRLATTGAEWYDTFQLYNSGTYNNQWIVVDMKKFTSGKPLSPGTLWIIEQIPGYMVGADQTAHLQSTGYWASYNIPFYPFIYNISGYPTVDNSTSHEFCARANIFRRDQNKVVDMSSMKDIMRYNEWQTDPLSLGDACRGIAARCDLNSPTPCGTAIKTLNGASAFGAIDGKITSNELSTTLSADIISGPSWDSQPPFAWTRQWKNKTHLGLPSLFNFSWLNKKPQF